MFEYYRGFSLKKLNTKEFSHVKLLFYWVIYGSFFFFVERVTPNRNWTPMYCSMDDFIPFLEIFLIPYLFWFVYLVGMLIYTFFYDITSFKCLMWFIIITYSITMFIYLVYPTSQELRPEVFPRDNIFTRFLGWFYTFDTNTNVNPSIHVIGSLAVMFTSWHSEKFSTPLWKIAFTVCGVLISISTVFVKQHSIIDVITAVLLCVFIYPVIFKRKKVAR
ncbi:MAG: phosphatase PAP2 family protein [Clostridia bacterium]|nr:phosphatase PAP2 family protein [Clostridia bacterium]